MVTYGDVWYRRQTIEVAAAAQESGEQAGRGHYLLMPQQGHNSTAPPPPPPGTSARQREASTALPLCMYVCISARQREATSAARRYVPLARGEIFFVGLGVVGDLGSIAEVMMCVSCASKGPPLHLDKKKKSHLCACASVSESVRYSHSHSHRQS